MANVQVTDIPERAIDYAEKYLFPLCDEPEHEHIRKALILAKEEGKLIMWKMLQKNYSKTSKKSFEQFVNHNIEKSKNYIRALCFKYKIFYDCIKS